MQSPDLQNHRAILMLAGARFFRTHQSRARAIKHEYPSIVLWHFVHSGTRAASSSAKSMEDRPFLVILSGQRLPRTGAAYFSYRGDQPEWRSKRPRWHHSSFGQRSIIHYDASIL